MCDLLKGPDRTPFPRENLGKDCNEDSEYDYEKLKPYKLEFYRNINDMEYYWARNPLYYKCVITGSGANMNVKLYYDISNPSTLFEKNTGGLIAEAKFSDDFNELGEVDRVSLDSLINEMYSNDYYDPENDIDHRGAGRFALYIGLQTMLFLGIDVDEDTSIAVLPRPSVFVKMKQTTEDLDSYYSDLGFDEFDEPEVDSESNNIVVRWGYVGKIIDQLKSYKKRHNNTL